MEFHSVEKGFIPRSDMAIFEQIAAVVREMPNLTFDITDPVFEGCNNQVSCYLLTRALAHYFPVWIRDGAFTHYDHSWLLSPTRKSIIDPYPVGGAAPIIVDADSMWSSLYKTQRQKLFRTPEFFHQLELTTQFVGKTTLRLGVSSRAPF